MAEKCRIKVIKEVLEIYPMYRPKLGKVYDAMKGKSTKKTKDFVIVDIRDKRIVLRKGEFEVVGC